MCLLETSPWVRNLHNPQLLHRHIWKPPREGPRGPLSPVLSQGKCGPERWLAEHHGYLSQTLVPRSGPLAGQASFWSFGFFSLPERKKDDDDEEEKKTQRWVCKTSMKFYASSTNVFCSINSSLSPIPTLMPIRVGWQDRTLCYRTLFALGGSHRMQSPSTSAHICMLCHQSILPVTGTRPTQQGWAGASICLEQLRQKGLSPGLPPTPPHIEAYLPFHPKACSPNRTQSLGTEQFWASSPLPDAVFWFSDTLKVGEVATVSPLPFCLGCAHSAPGLRRSCSAQGFRRSASQDGGEQGPLQQVPRPPLLAPPLLKLQQTVLQLIR